MYPPRARGRARSGPELDAGPPPDRAGSSMQPMTTSAPPLRVRDWKAAEYLPTLQAMREFTARRTEATPDELWLVEHPPVYTQGLAGRPEHVHDAGAIPVVATERGGQV